MPLQPKRFSRARKAIAGSIALAAFAMSAHAGGQLAVSESTSLNAPPAEVWAVIGRFGDLAWHPAAAKTEITHGRAGEAGAVRKITLPDGALIIEEQVSQDDAARALRYRIVESPLPVHNYLSELKVEPQGKGSKVVWSSTFDANQGVADADARKTISGVYTGGFEALNARFGTISH